MTQLELNDLQTALTVYDKYKDKFGVALMAHILKDWCFFSKAIELGVTVHDENLNEISPEDVQTILNYFYSPECTEAIFNKIKRGS